MGFVAAFVATQLFARAVRNELKRSGHTQHPAITRIGLVAVELL